MKTCLLALLLAAAAVAQVSPQTLVPSDKVVARIDGRDITAGEVREAMANMPPDFQQFFAQNPAYGVQQLYMMRYLAELAENAKLGEQTPLKEQLAVARQNMLATAMLSHEQNSYIPPEEAVEAYYNRNRSKFQLAKVRMILVSFKGNPATAKPGNSLEELARSAVESAQRPQRTEQDARVRADEIRAKLKAGQDFEKLVVEYSDDAASKAKGGEVSVNHASPESAEVKNAVFALMPGEISDPLRSTDSFVIVMMEEKSIEPLNNVKLPIIKELRSTHMNEWFANVNVRFTPQIQSQEFFRQAPQTPKVPGPRPPVPLK